MQNVNTIALASLIVATVGTFLVGQRLNARWAGGSGRIEPCPAVLVGGNSTVLRGEIMSTSGGFAEYQFCNGMLVYLDKNTQIRLDGYPHDVSPTSLNLIQGRVILDGAFEVRARNVTISSGPGCELVHYSWLDELDVTALADQACKLQATRESPPSGQTTKYNTFDGKSVTVSDFTPEASAAKEFYVWTGLEFENLP